MCLAVWYSINLMTPTMCSPKQRALSLRVVQLLASFILPDMDGGIIMITVLIHEILHGLQMM